MSQRGAQQMANEGLRYDQILEFYYPGIVRTRYTMTRTILPSLDGTGGAGDELISDARSAIVTLSNPLDSLNLRREPNASSAILATIAHGTQVTLLEMGSAWSRIQYGTLSGYVLSHTIKMSGAINSLHHLIKRREVEYSSIRLRIYLFYRRCKNVINT